MNLKTLALIPKDLPVSGSWSLCTAEMARRLSMNRSAELRSGANKPCRVTIAPGRRPALQFRSSWSRCMRKKRKGAFHDRNSQTRTTNDEIRRNTEIQKTNEPFHTRALFDIRASDFFRHLSFVIRQPVHGPNR